MMQIDSVDVSEKNYLNKIYKSRKTKRRRQERQGETKKLSIIQIYSNS